MTLMRLCIAPGCDELAESGGNRCQEHRLAQEARIAARKAEAKTSDIARKGSELYKSSAWVRARRGWLARHPLCVECNAVGVVVSATDVDHIIPHRGDRALFWRSGNWQSLCKACHSRKTAREVLHLGDRVGG